MDPEKDTKTDVNAGAAESSTEANQTTQAIPPTEENSGAPATDDRKIPYGRFTDVISQRNEERQRREALEARVRELESRGSVSEINPNAEAERLAAKLKIDVEAAKEIVGVARKVSQADREADRARLQQFELDRWNRNMESRHKDYNDMAPAMEKVFSSLPPAAQHLVVSSEEGLEMLYNQTKALVAKDNTSKAFKQGVDSAYQKKEEKKALSSVPGSGSKGLGQEVSLEYLKSIAGNTEEYKKNLKRINHWLETGQQL